MKTATFVLVVLVSGAIAGTIHGVANLVLVEPYLDETIMAENRALFASGLAADTPEFWVAYDSYRDWQKGGQLLASAILGMSMGALFGIVYALARNVLPRGDDLKKAAVLAAIMWFSIYLVPFLKYPANPPTVGDGETIALRTALYLVFVAMSGFGAAGFYLVYKRLAGNRRIVAFAGYASMMTVVFILMPPNPDEVSIQSELLDGFRLAAAVGTSIFWAALAVILGFMWGRFRPDLESRLERH